MYLFNFHHVEPVPTHADRKHITVTPEGLQNIIRTLRAVGLHIVSLADVLRAGGPHALPLHTAVLTFDDGYENFLTHALPALEAEQAPATVFVLAGRFSGTNTWDQGNLPEGDRDRLLSLAQMQTLAQSPWVAFGSHGMLHQRFSQLDPSMLSREIEDSYQVLKDALGEAFLPVLAYPWGDTSPGVSVRMTQSPYHYAFTTEKGVWRSPRNPYNIPRYSVFYRDGHPLILLAKLLRNGILPGCWLGRFSKRLSERSFTGADARHEARRQGVY